MAGDLDRALDDIISEDTSNRHPRRQARRAGARRNSPYTRRDRQQGRWEHDRYEGASINDRLGPGRSMDSRLDGRLGRSSPPQPTNGRSQRGLAIARRSRDTKPYLDMRVVWVTGLPHEMTSEKLERMFSNTGRVDAVRMAIDKRDRFVGKAEIEYRLAEDARDAIQVFDGEMLYSEEGLQTSMSVSHSDPVNADYIDDLKFENTLPAPRAGPPVDDPGAADMGMASAAMLFPMMPMLAGGPGRDRRGTGGGRGDRRSQRSSEATPTAEQLDADMDAYMKAGQADAASQHGAADGHGAQPMAEEDI
ncbi:hypothetical protein GGF46_003902 [Coemansia sp. RSA 552]|nr:hypothetical protein GGF46_003902 [Coemansia sp. RSA 552]